MTYQFEHNTSDYGPRRIQFYRKYIDLYGWPKSVPSELKPYSNCKGELSSINGCLLYGYGVVVPPHGQRQIMSELHQGHLGLPAFSRMYIWWPGMDDDIQELVKTCGRKISPMYQLHHYNHGDGQHIRGVAFTLIMRDHSWIFYLSDNSRCTFEMDRDFSNFITNIIHNDQLPTYGICQIGTTTHNSV